ncbi:P-loop containing nucleoside triphosphate hydrolase protein [Mycena crocata]|nr:P-loop containing nucleoside triphosphate hydrolase protein [Mycena crocata]
MNSKQVDEEPLLPRTVSSYGPVDDKSIVDSSGEVRRFTLGIFQVAYGVPVCHPSLNALRRHLQDLRHSAPCGLRLFLEIYRTARVLVIVHLLAVMLLIVAPAFSLYLSASILGIVEDSVMTRKMTDLHVNVLQVLIFMWLFNVIMNSLSSRIKVDTENSLRGHLRAHFLPQLANGWETMSSLPLEHSFDSEVPCLRFFQQIVTRFRNFLTVIAVEGVLVMIIARRGIHETQLLAFFSLMLPAVILLKPNSGVGGAGYVFWTSNSDFYYLAALHKLAFSQHFRATLTRDGLCSYISQEYQRVSAALGYFNIDTFSMQAALQVQWYWDILQTLIVEHPLPLCALMIPWTDPVASLVTMVLVQHATSTLFQIVRDLKWQGPDTLAEVLRWAKQHYDAIALDSKLYHGTAPYPDPMSSEVQGMKVSFRNVSFKHGEDEPFAVSDVSFDIQAGNLAIIVGANGSGKSTLLSFLPRVKKSTGGEILIDGRPIDEYDVESLRGTMACLSQNEDMYPVSLRENMLMGTAQDIWRDAENLDRAATMGCASQLIDRLPSKWDTILDPVPLCGQSPQGCGNGYISKAAMSELDAHGPSFKPTAVSGGEKQRLAATRLFSRLLSLKDSARLIICDEITGAMDPRTESDILRRVKGMRVGKTVILVTHRFGELVKEADVILVMKEGRLVQHGTHEELMLDTSGEYAEMYSTQANGFL